jgi:hypothetical protein
VSRRGKLGKKAKNIEKEPVIDFQDTEIKDSADQYIIIIRVIILN